MKYDKSFYRSQLKRLLNRERNCNSRECCISSMLGDDFYSCEKCYEYYTVSHCDLSRGLEKLR